MAIESVSITPGSGKDIAVDTVAGKEYQCVKLALGAEDALDNVVDSGQQTMAASVPVVLASNHTDVKVTLDSEAVVLGTGTASIGKLTDDQKIDVNKVAGASVAVGAGTEATCLRVTLPTDGTGQTVVVGKTSADSAIAAAPVTIGGRASASAPSDMSADGDVVNASFDRHGCLRVNVHEALPAGTALIGKVGIDQTTPGTTNLVSIGTNGTVTANLSATDNAVLDTIDAVLDTIDAGTSILAAGVANGHYQVDVLSAPSTAVTNAGTFAVQATLAAGTAGIGKLTANSGVDIGDVDVLSIVPGVGATNLGKAEDAAHSSGDVGVMALAVRKDTPVATAAADDYTPFQTDSEGRQWVNTRPGTIWAAFHDGAAAHTDIALQAAPGASLSLYVTDLIITNDGTAAITVKLEEDTASAKTALTAIMYIPANGGIVSNYTTPLKLTANKDLGFTSTGTSNFGLEVRGFTQA